MNKFFLIRQSLNSMQEHEALKQLQNIAVSTAVEEHEKAYLTGWAYALSSSWDAVRDSLDPLLPPSLKAVREEETLSIWEQVALAWLRVGAAAFNLGNTLEATIHLRACISFFSKRAMRRSDIKYQAHLVLAQVILQRGGLAKEALLHLKDAERYGTASEEKEWEPTICKYRAEAYRQLGNLASMREEAHKALRLYEQNGNVQQQAHVLLFMGKWSQASTEETLKFFEETLSIAHSLRLPSLAVEAYIELSTYARNKGELGDARTYAYLARSTVDGLENRVLSVRVLVESCHVHFALVEQATDDEKRSLYEQAEVWIRQAIALALGEDFPSLAAEVYGVFGQILEGLGRTEEARAAYAQAVILRK